MGYAAGFLTPQACQFTCHQALSYMYSLVYPDESAE